MELWLSRSLSHEFSFSRWNLGYHEAFLMIFLHGGISAITEPFYEFFFCTVEYPLSKSLFTNFSFSQWNISYHGAFSRIFLSHGGISAVTKPFHEFFFHVLESWLSRAFSRIFLSCGEFAKCTIWGKKLFIYITKTIYIGSASLKTLPLDLEPPFQGKDYGPHYSNAIAKKKANVFFSEITYRFVIRLFGFLECKLAKKGKNTLK
jgi:hypothetical protein